jgi:hypothetical protein
MNNTELLNTVEYTAQQTEELVNIANTNVELSEEQLHEIDGGGGFGYWVARALPYVMSPIPALVYVVADTVGPRNNSFLNAIDKSGDSRGKIGSDLEDKIRGLL